MNLQPWSPVASASNDVGDVAPRKMEDEECNRLPPFEKQDSWLAGEGPRRNALKSKTARANADWVAVWRSGEGAEVERSVRRASAVFMCTGEYILDCKDMVVYVSEIVNASLFFFFELVPSSNAR